MQVPNRSPRLLAILTLLLPIVAFLGVPRPSARADENKDTQAALKAAAALYDGIRVETLANGLKVYLKPVPGSPVVTTMVAYKVGSADEDLDATGLSHYLEHLMFKGTDKIMPGDIDRQTLINGGANNAYTSEDLTNYHFDFAADRWEVALAIEADRMRNLRIDAKHEFEQEKGAVIEELQRNEDEPWDLEQKAILPLLFGKTAPYGHPVIGERQHVRGATAKVIKAHYDKWYYPNNASLVVVGGFDPDKALARIKELFGSIPKGDLPERKSLPKEIPGKRPARVEMPSKFEVPRLLMGFNGVATSDADYPALNVLEGILGTGKTARLYKHLVEGAEIASMINASTSSGRYPGWFAIQVELLKGKDRAEAEKLVVKELRKLIDQPVSAEELKRVQQGILASTIFARESVHGLADSIAQGVTTNDLNFLKNYLPRVLAVTAADVQRVAKKYLDPDKAVTVWSVPGKGATRKDGERGAQSAERKDRERFALRAPRSTSEGAGGKEFSLKDAKRVELPNGLVLLLFENHRLPIIVAHARVRDAHLYESDEKLGVASLTGDLLDEGTTRHTGPQIAEMIENVGGSLALSSGGGSVRVLTPDRELGLGLLFECLMEPTFPKEAFARDQARQLSAIDEAETQPDSRARRAFRAAVYGKHPNGRPPLGTRKTVEKLTPEDCKHFHQQVFVPNNATVAIVGDFNSDQVIKEVTRLTANWKKTDLKRPTTPPVEKPEKFTQKIITMPEAAQLHFLMGHVGVRRNNPDFYKLLVMDYVLGTGPGFTDRLSSRLRDREGLAYTVQANISSSAEIEPGVFTCYIGTAPDNFERVKKEFLEEMNRLRDEEARPEEVENAKKYLLGSLPFQFTTNAAIAGQLLMVERYGLGFGYLDDYRKAVGAVTPADVQAVARKFIDPKRMVLVAAGAIDSEGKPIHKAPPPKP
jgi:zinc protease